MCWPRCWPRCGHLLASVTVVHAFAAPGLAVALLALRGWELVTTNAAFMTKNGGKLFAYTLYVLVGARDGECVAGQPLTRCSAMCPQLVWIEHYPHRRQLVCCHPDDLHLLCCVRGLALRGRSVSRSRFGVAHEFGRVCSAIYIPLTFVPSMTVRHTAICMAICMCVARALSHVPGSRLPTAGVQGRPRFGRRLCPRGCQDREPSRCRCSPGQRRVTLDVCPVGACGTVVAVGSPVCCKPHSTSAVPLTVPVFAAPATRLPSRRILQTINVCPNASRLRTCAPTCLQARSAAQQGRASQHRLPGTKNVRRARIQM